MKCKVETETMEAKIQIITDALQTFRKNVNLCINNNSNMNEIKDLILQRFGDNPRLIDIWCYFDKNNLMTFLELGNLEDYESIEFKDSKLKEIFLKFANSKDPEVRWILGSYNPKVRFYEHYVKGWSTYLPLGDKDCITEFLDGTDETRRHMIQEIDSYNINIEKIEDKDVIFILSLLSRIMC